MLHGIGREWSFFGFARLSVSLESSFEGLFARGGGSLAFLCWALWGVARFFFLALAAVLPPGEKKGLGVF